MILSSDLKKLTVKLRAFAAERDWEKFHSPKNLSMALSVEAAELLELFQWKSDEESRTLTEDERSEAAAELADILLYLLQISDKLGVDLADAAESKLLVNAEKYPVSVAFGSSKKANKHSKS